MSEYGFLDGVPIDPDPSMPAGQKRWEIVPACEVETRDMEYTLDGLEWHQNYSSKSRGVASWGAVLAFRRPITPALRKEGDASCLHSLTNSVVERNAGEETNPAALKEAGAGSLELSPMIAIGAERQGIGIGGMVDEKPRPMFAGNTRTLVDKITALQSELTQLRTLVKDQGEALEKAEKELQDFDNTHSSWDRHGMVCPYCARDDGHDSSCMVLSMRKALTLIAKLKEVGE